jgi:hypothetical protein
MKLNSHQKSKEDLSKKDSQSHPQFNLKVGQLPYKDVILLVLPKLDQEKR